MGVTESKENASAKIKPEVVFDFIRQLKKAENSIHTIAEDISVFSLETQGVLDSKNLLRQYQNLFFILGSALSLIYSKNYIEVLKDLYGTTLENLYQSDRLLGLLNPVSSRISTIES